jgi:phosphoadenosine phosphosulfate reductase
MDKWKNAIEVFKLGSQLSQRNYGKSIVVTYSGGKDSDVLLEVAKASGERFEVHNSHTTCDAPQTVYHIRNKFRELELKGIKCTIEHPKYKGENISMWSLIPQKLIPPTRIARYCCQVLKETGCTNRMIATGVRWAESNARKQRAEFETITSRKQNSIKINKEIMLMNDNNEKRKLIEHCQLKSKSCCNPIIAFSENDVWELLNDLKVKTNPLYDMGYSRVGCIGCPMAGKCKRKQEFADFPKYKQLYIRAFEQMLEVRKSKKLPTQFKSGEDVFLWWMEDDNIEGQLSFDYENERITSKLIENY